MSFSNGMFRAHRRASMIFCGMGVSQHVHGTDNARCLIASGTSPHGANVDGESAHRSRPSASRFHPLKIQQIRLSWSDRNTESVRREPAGHPNRC